MSAAPCPNREGPDRAPDGIAFFGGGTGGHLFPGIAVAERARERFPGVRTVFFRTSRAVEDRVFGGREVEMRSMTIAPPGRRPGGWLRYLRDVRVAARDALSAFGAGRWIVFGLGGYASLPGLVAARRRRAPAILLEQNRVAGKVTRLLAPWASAVCLSFPETRVRFSRRLEATGNPVRRDVIAAADDRRAEDRRVGPRPRGGRMTVLVVGGSQGAHGLNRGILEALPRLGAFSGRIRWIHVAGDADKDCMREAYRTHGWDAEVLAYSADLPRLMARSDLVLSRAGGTTLAEIAVIGVPAVLVPYPHHRDRHQSWNARTLEERGAAIVVEEPMLDSGSLRNVFEDILFVPERLEAMGRSARSIARPMASDSVLDLALDLSKSCRSLSASFS